MRGREGDHGPPELLVARGLATLQQYRVYGAPDPPKAATAVLGVYYPGCCRAVLQWPRYNRQD